MSLDQALSDARAVIVRRWPVLERSRDTSRRLRLIRRTKAPLEERRVRLDRFTAAKSGDRPTRARLQFPSVAGCYEFSLDTGYGLGRVMRDWVLDEEDLKALRTERDRMYPVRHAETVRVPGPALRLRVNLRRYGVCAQCGAVHGPDDQLKYEERDENGSLILDHYEDDCEHAEYNVGVFIAHGMAALHGVRLKRKKPDNAQQDAAADSKQPAPAR